MRTSPFHRIAGILAESLLVVLAGSPLSHAQDAFDSIRVAVRPTLDSLEHDEDTDGDRRITADDLRVPGTSRGNKRFWLRALDGRLCEVTGTYFLSNLLQELSLDVEANRETAMLAGNRVFEEPVHRISRCIRELYWDGLTRRIDERGLLRIATDEKTSTVDGRRYVYTPHSDSLAFAYFSGVADRHPEWKLNIVRLPADITPEYVRSLDGRHGILTLGLRKTSAGAIEGMPFVVPGGRFNEMYGWDSYFILLGLLHDGRIELAKSMIDNFVYEITHYGKILNANRTYYLTRSQPPFLTSMIRAILPHLPATHATRAWLTVALEAAIREYRTVWTAEPKRTWTGLSRYFDTGFGPPPEVEPGRFDSLLTRYARKFGMDERTFTEAYLKRRVKVPELDHYFASDRSMRESGHDSSYRLEDKSADLVTVDLNSLLYKIETDIADLLDKRFGGRLRVSDGSVEEGRRWREMARRRQGLISRYLWDNRRGMYFDYDFVQKVRTHYVSATTFYPLWAGLATRRQAANLVDRALPLLETPGGIAASAESSRGPVTPGHPLLQWDYPFGWAPHQILIWQGLRNYGLQQVAARLAYKWLYTMTLNAVQYNGTVTEKYDVARRTHKVFAEYGNVGTTFSYITREGFGWTNASYQLGSGLLSAGQVHDLDRLVPPEWIFTP